MRKYLLISGIVALIMSAGNASAKRADSPVLPEPIQKLRMAAKQAQLINKQNATGPVWRPGKVKNFWWDGTNWQPKEDETFTNTYFEDGKIKSASNPYSRTEYQYDDKGRLVKELQYETVGGDRLQNTTTYTYDTVVENLVVKTETLSEWHTYTSGKEITRNEAGNIQLVRDYYINEEGQLQYSNERLSITYGADGKANTITEEYVIGNQVEVETKLTDIVWENTDGQIYTIDMDLEDADDTDDGIFFGANRIKSADFVGGFPGEAKLNCTYNSDNVGFNGKVTLGNEVVSSVVYTPFDEYGGYDMESYAVDFDFDEDTGKWERDGANREKVTYRVDKFGLVLLDMTEELPVEGEYDELEKWGEQGTVTYDPVTGYPTEYVEQEYSFDSGRFVNSQRTLYFDYTDVNAAAIESVESDSDAPVEYFNLRGIPVAHPENGIFILRQGTKTSKILVK